MENIPKWKRSEGRASRPDHILVDVVAHIRKNATGEVREFATEEILDNDAEFPSTFNWAENNFKCDCNRALFWARAKGDEEPDQPCGETEYSVNLQNPADGKFYYNEF